MYTIRSLQQQSIGRGALPAPTAFLVRNLASSEPYLTVFRPRASHQCYFDRLVQRYLTGNGTGEFQSQQELGVA